MLKIISGYLTLSHEHFSVVYDGKCYKRFNYKAVQMLYFGSKLTDCILSSHTVYVNASSRRPSRRLYCCLV